MPARPALIKQADLARIARAMQAGGVREWRVDLDPSGKVSIVAGGGTTEGAASDPASDWADL